jgi:glycosyltransferase involved in cell wall biosynthesis
VTRSVLFCGAWDEGSGYPRTAALRQGLLAQGFVVHECRAEALGRGKQRLLAQPWRWPFWAAAELVRRIRFRRRLRAALSAHRPEFVVVPYPGHHLVAAVKSVARVPVVLDLFLSAYDTAVVDRGLFAPSSWPAKVLRQLDRRACASADLVLLDTEANALNTARLTGLPTQHFDWLPVGDPAAPQQCAPYAPPAGGPLRLLFFGTGVPLHGLPVLIEAVARAPDVALTLIGGTAADRAQARQALGNRLELLPEFVERAELQVHIDHSHLVAGVFGCSPKVERVVPFKVVHALASGRPVVTADAAAVRAAVGGDAAVFTVPAGDAAALAARLRELAGAPALLQRAAEAARPLYDRAFAVGRTGARFSALLDRLPAGADGRA